MRGVRVNAPGKELVKPPLDHLRQQGQRNSAVTIVIVIVVPEDDVTPCEKSKVSLSNRIALCLSVSLFLLFPLCRLPQKDERSMKKQRAFLFSGSRLFLGIHHQHQI